MTDEEGRHIHEILNMPNLEWKNEVPQQFLPLLEQLKASPDPIGERYPQWCREFVAALSHYRHRGALNAVRQLLLSNSNLSYIVRHCYDFVEWHLIDEHTTALVRSAKEPRRNSKRRIDSIKNKCENLRNAMSKEADLKSVGIPTMSADYHRIRPHLLALIDGALQALQELYAYEESHVRLDTSRSVSGIMLALRLRYIASADPEGNTARWWKEVAAIMKTAAEVMIHLGWHSMPIPVFDPNRLRVMASDIKPSDMALLVAGIKFAAPDFFERAADRPLQETISVMDRRLAFQPSPRSKQVIQLAHELQRLNAEK